MPASPPNKYTCADYRDEMRLLGLRRRLEKQDLTEEERRRVLEEVREIERKMAMD